MRHSRATLELRVALLAYDTSGLLAAPELDGEVAGCGREHWLGWVPASGFRVQGVGCRVKGVGCRV